MKQIMVLDHKTIDKIAAGEVIERPFSIVKELVENAVDAGATAITIEIKNGGIDFIRVTDNGEGIAKEEVRNAFLRHATSKIRSVEDLFSISSLGFRGEALASIASICRMELITKTPGEMEGVHYIIEGGNEIELKEIGAPNGSTFIVRNVFYNTPVRKKFLKAEATEASYIAALVERLALSNPAVSFKFINNNQTKLFTTGNDNSKEIIYHIYGRDVAGQLIAVDDEKDGIRIKGFIGKPNISRANRNFENYYINGRYTKNKVVTQSLEDAYSAFLMQHKYPFAALFVQMDADSLDINVHPTKMEVRFSDPKKVYDCVNAIIKESLERKEFIPSIGWEEKKNNTKPGDNPQKNAIPEPFETKRLQKETAKADYVKEESGYRADHTLSQVDNIGIKKSTDAVTKALIHTKDDPIVNTVANITLNTASNTNVSTSENTINEKVLNMTLDVSNNKAVDTVVETTVKNKSNVIAIEASGNTTNASITNVETNASANASTNTSLNTSVNTSANTSTNILLNTSIEKETDEEIDSSTTQLNLFEDKFLNKDNKKEYKIIGQVFKTYWMVEWKDTLYIMDQHAAHEKVLYEQIIKDFQNKEIISQYLSPPLIISLTLEEEQTLMEFQDYFKQFGFEIEHFGGKEYSVRAVPSNLLSINESELFMEILDDLTQVARRDNPQVISEKIASMACKGAVKGNQKLSFDEVVALFDKLFTLDNPYHCPHGRPTLVAMTKNELEKKFKRIL